MVRQGARYFLPTVFALLALPRPAHAADEQLGRDKALHFGVSVALSAGGYAGSSLFLEKPWQRSALAGSLFSLSVGAGKKASMPSPGGDASFKDLRGTRRGLWSEPVSRSASTWRGSPNDAPPGPGEEARLDALSTSGSSAPASPEPAAALFLARAGHRVSLYEEALSPAAIGAGILIQPTGQRVLRELGLLDAAVACGSKVEKLLCLTSHGKPVLDPTYDDFEPGWFGLGMHRGALFELLFDAPRRTLGSTFARGARCRSFEHARGRVTPLTSSGARLGEHELVVVADGARSGLRDPRDTERARPYPWGALWLVARDPGRVFSGSLHQVTDSTTALLGFLPSGTRTCRHARTGAGQHFLERPRARARAKAALAERLEARGHRGSSRAPKRCSIRSITPISCSRRATSTS